MILFTTDQLISIIQSELVRHIAEHGAAEAIFCLFRKKRKRRLSRSQRKKLITRRRRKFVDTVIMRHQRIHQKNRDIVLEEPEELIRKRKLKRKKKKDKEKELKKESKSHGTHKWQDSEDLKHKGTIIRGRIDARRLKARSKWLSVSS